MTHKTNRKKEIEPLVLPAGDKLLLHSCCAPCSGDVMNELAAYQSRLHAFDRRGSTDCRL